MEKVKHLLNLVEMIDEKYKHIQKQNTDFNLFTVLRNESDEVNLHSQFIVELLYRIPYYSPIFLKLFLKTIGLENEWIGSEVRVLKEYKNIDILIKSRDRNIIIENKIYAEDQDKQLERYYEEVYRPSKNTRDTLKIYYLTLDGADPTKESLGEKLCSMNNVIEGKFIVNNLSYKEHISSWIEECIKESATAPGLRESLIQYLEVVNRLSGNTKDKNVENEIASLLLKSPESLLLAKSVVEGYEKAIVDLKFKFWKELEYEILQDKFFRDFKVIDFRKYSKKLIKGNNNFYGVMIPIKKVGNDKELCVMFEVCEQFYIGYFFKNKKNEYIDLKQYKNSNKYKNIITDILNEESYNLDYSTNYSNDIYLAWLYYKERLAYKKPNETFLSLVDDQVRNNKIKEIVISTSKLTSKILKELGV